MAKIDEVARVAGVSISTVSYALSGKRPVSAATRQRIELAVRELGYSPNAGARMLAGSQTNIFALSEPLRADSHAPSHMAFMHAMTVAARRREYDMLLLTDEDASAGMKRVAASGLVDAVLVLDVAPDDPRVAIARASATPTVFVGIPDDHGDLVCVDLDFESAATQAVDRLVDAGHERIGLIGGSRRAYEKSNFPPRVRDTVVTRAAERGATATAVASGEIVTDRALVRQAVRRFVDDGVTGIVLHAPEEVAQVVLVELEALGRRMPDDVSIVSVGSSFDTDSLPTPIDSIPLVPQSSCERAVDLAIELVAGRPVASGLHLISPTYLDRGSVAVRPLP
ncbi:LacI family DNA-binding transcriptional regulator [Microbacterium sp. KSW2-21]|uniref:LacI family DNA-binding transcriptional regulator n=1 Tax=Microbacterium algihabitans TaxID=3075992 RepID=A0ABU3RTU7_9MICO|nr:LacI family DNA-binding transcriptional regulator [Microbacterium sp. KSW2-21]MDU0326342.1 LacI family DNA-binding transcriptional regulator [Microbacterium sp. KSW2-21]